jgi:hypothetical protein
LAPLTATRRPERGDGLSTIGGTATINRSSINRNLVNTATTGTSLGRSIGGEDNILSHSNDTIDSNQTQGNRSGGRFRNRPIAHERPGRLPFGRVGWYETKSPF